MKKTVALVVATVVLIVGVGLSPLLLGAAFVMMFGSSDAVQSCSPNDSIADGFEVPGPADEGGTITLTSDQIGYVATLTEVAADLEVPRAGVTIAIMTALQESRLQNLANSTVPESLELPHDGVGADHDSVGLMQQRANWGTVAERLDVEYAWRAFFGGEDGPNGGTPPGLLDITDWESLGLGEAAQAVQISAFPERYDRWEGTADSILVQLTGGCSSSVDTPGDVSTEGWTSPAEGTLGDLFGPRGTICQSGICTPGSHSGVDIINSAGTPIAAAADGTVTYAQQQEMGGWTIMVSHGDGLMTLYGHMLPGSFLVGVGDEVEAGQVIGHMGSSGLATGVHLHFSVYVDGAPTDPIPFMAERGVELGQAA